MRRSVEWVRRVVKRTSGGQLGTASQLISALPLDHKSTVDTAILDTTRLHQCHRSRRGRPQYNATTCRPQHHTA